MIHSISYWSLPGGLSSTLAIDAAMGAAPAAAGFAGIELAIAQTGVLTPATDQETCETYRRAAEKHGLALHTLASGMSWGCCPTDPNPAVRGRAVQLHYDALQRAAWLGCRALLYVPGAVTIPWDRAFGPIPYEAAVDRAREGVARLAPRAEELGIDLCIENVWNGMFYSPLEFRAFVDSFHSERVGVYLDVGNLLGYHQYPPHWIELLGKRIKRVHLKDYKCSVGGLAGFCDLLAGDVPWGPTLAALRAIGYDQTLVAEMMPPDAGLLARTLAAMQRLATL